MLHRKPAFVEGSKLTRYIHPDFRGRKNRPKPAAYQLTENEEYLSVNSTEVQTVNQIAEVYATIFEQNRHPIAIACPTLASYNEAATGVGLEITYNDSTKCWEFRKGSGWSTAYRHWRKAGNASHCGVQYLGALSDRDGFHFAVRMHRVATYQMK